MTAKVVSQSEWLEARKTLLQKEKDLVRANDALSAERRALPMVLVEKDYVFHGPDGKLSLNDLFAGKDQLIIYHFMFGPDDEVGCHGCAFLSEHIPDVRLLATKNTSLVVVSRAPFAKLDAWKKRLGWAFPWYSSEGSDFNYDFHATLDETRQPVQYNFASQAELEAKGQTYNVKGEQPGLSVFFRRKDDGRILHSYSAYSRGLDKILGTLQLLDFTPLGRQDGPYGPGDYKFNYEYDEADA